LVNFLSVKRLDGYNGDMLLIFDIFAVRGMMYYRKALELQAFLDMAMHEGVFL